MYYVWIITAYNIILPYYQSNLAQALFVQIGLPHRSQKSEKQIPTSITHKNINMVAFFIYVTKKHRQLSIVRYLKNFVSFFIYSTVRISIGKFDFISSKQKLVFGQLWGDFVSQTWIYALGQFYFLFNYTWLFNKLNK